MQIEVIKVEGSRNIWFEQTYVNFDLILLDECIGCNLGGKYVMQNVWTLIWENSLDSLGSSQLIMDFIKFTGYFEILVFV